MGGRYLRILAQRPVDSLPQRQLRCLRAGTHAPQTTEEHEPYGGISGWSHRWHCPFLCVHQNKVMNWTFRYKIRGFIFAAS
jgi:hypothetical protein